MPKKTECQELGWTKKHEKNGFYNEDGRLVHRFMGVGIPSGIIPHDANFLQVSFLPDNFKEWATHTMTNVKPSKTGQWVVLFTHPDFPSVKEGCQGAVISCVKKDKQ